MYNIEVKCMNIKETVDKIMHNLGNELKDPIFRDNYLDIGIHKYENMDDQMIFKCFITFYDTAVFLNKYKEYNKDVNKIAQFYQTDINLVNYYIRLLKNINKR